MIHHSLDCPRLCLPQPRGPTHVVHIQPCPEGEGPLATKPSRAAEIGRFEEPRLHAFDRRYGLKPRFGGILVA